MKLGMNGANTHYRLLVEPLVPHVDRDDQHVIGWCLRGGAGRNSHRLKERICLRQVDHSIDAGHHG